MSDVVERAKAALEGVTDGPWEATPYGVEQPYELDLHRFDQMTLRIARTDESDNDSRFIAAARTLVPELVSELERVREACKTLGDLTVQLNQMALDATGLHHLIGEDGDGDWAAVWENLAQLGSGNERLRAEHREFASRLEFGDGVTEPAASLADMLDPIKAAFSEARDHQECPHTCEQCGERLASTLCPDCHGSGGDAALCEASGAYVECEQCGGAGWIHEGCAEVGYADLKAEVERLRATVERVRELAGNPETYSGTGVVTVTPRRILAALDADR